MKVKLSAHYFALPDEPLPPVSEQLLCDYVIGANGAFVRGRRPGLEVCLPIGQFEMGGLSKVWPYVQWGFPKVPRVLLQRMLNDSRAVCAGGPAEALFHLSWRSGEVRCENWGWSVEFPDQHATENSVVPIETGMGTSTDRAIIELHSHHGMEAEFSYADDVDEAQGFRVYAVIGRIFEKPEIRVRVGLFGRFLEYAASEFFELPQELRDCVAEEMRISA